MFSGINALGDQQAEVPEWYGVEDQEQGDIDFVSANFYSPDAGYPPDRMELYDADLVQPVTLNSGVGAVSRTVAPYRGSAFGMRAPHLRFLHAAKPATTRRNVTPARRFSGGVYNPNTRTYASR